MPVVEFHLAEGLYADDQLDRLLDAASLLYAEVLNSPIDRVRVYLHLVKPEHMAVGGKRVSRGAPAAPYFTFLVLEGRPLAECEALMAGFTDLLVEILGVERGLVRGGCRPIPPQYWSIGGVSAASLRAGEIAARAETAKGGQG